jgi:peptidoglycan/xylan/chitin deacetylase (PgdA/CDA1 family)
MIHMADSLRNAIFVVFLILTTAAIVRGEALAYDKYGGIVRGDVAQKKLALIFTGDEKGESTRPILDTLKRRKIAGGFFVTGNFLAQPELKGLVGRALEDGHYVGPHSDKHLLYASWDDRAKSLVSREVFTADLRKNLKELRAIGALKGKVALFVPPYEHFNQDQVEWCKPINVTLFNFTPGSGSNRDYATEGDPHFASSQKIFDDILAYEQKDPHGLNGFSLLMHLGSGRKDPLHPRLGALCDELAKRGYEFVRIDALLQRR